MCVCVYYVCVCVCAGACVHVCVCVCVCVIALLYVTLVVKSAMAFIKAVLSRVLLPYPGGAGGFTACV